jgi:DNA-binding NarL/FixJ family response regulator
VISRNTVRRHVSHIFDKTGVTNRAQAVVYAKEHGIA